MPNPYIKQELDLSVTWPDGTQIYFQETVDDNARVPLTPYQAVVAYATVAGRGVTAGGRTQIDWRTELLDERLDSAVVTAADNNGQKIASTTLREYAFGSFEVRGRTMSGGVTEVAVRIHEKRIKPSPPIDYSKAPALKK